MCQEVYLSRVPLRAVFGSGQASHVADEIPRERKEKRSEIKNRSRVSSVDQCLARRAQGPGSPFVGRGYSVLFSVWSVAEGREKEEGEDAPPNSHTPHTLLMFLDQSCFSSAGIFFRY